MKKILFVIILSLAAKYADASQGYIIAKDLNGDGIQDLIASGPYEQFKYKEGPFLLRISTEDGSYSEKVLRLVMNRVAIENSNAPKLWGVEGTNLGGTDGVIVKITLDGKFEEEVVSGHYGSSSDKALFRRLFGDAVVLKFLKISNYTVPRNTVSNWWK